MKKCRIAPRKSRTRPSSAASVDVTPPSSSSLRSRTRVQLTVWRRWRRSCVPWCFVWHCDLRVVLAMTLLLACANRGNAYLFADRRLTANGIVYDEEFDKSGTVVFRDSRFAFGMTGIARAMGLNAHDWLIRAIGEALEPDNSGEHTLHRLRDLATKDFAIRPEFARLGAADKRFAVMFAGYVYAAEMPFAVAVIISNYLDMVLHPTRQAIWPVAQPEFKLMFRREKLPPSPRMGAVLERIGSGRVDPKHLDGLTRLLKEQRPPQSIVGKATEVMLEAADRPASRGTVGKQITWIQIPADPTVDAQHGYYSNVPTGVVYAPSAIIANVPVGHVMFKDMALMPLDRDHPPMKVPKVGRNAPCPCKSGKKYKKCHGR